jgi:hypothetical protein
MLGWWMYWALGWRIVLGTGKTKREREKEE